MYALHTITPCKCSDPDFGYATSSYYISALEAKSEKAVEKN